MADDRLIVGRVGRAHGLQGEVAVVLLTDRSERVAPGAVLYVDGRELHVTASRPQADRWLVRFQGVEDRTEAESLRGAVLSADRLVLEPDDPTMFVHELIGATVRDRTGTLIGVVDAVEANPASDLLVVRGPEGREHLVPLRFLVERTGASLVVDLPAGLLDL